MSEQKATPRNSGGSRRGAQAVAGVAGAVACLGIGGAAGARSAATHATASPATTSVTQPTYPTIAVGWGDDDGREQWGTVPGTGQISGQPGVGIVPPTTGSGGSAVATTSLMANATMPSATGATATANPVGLMPATRTARGAR
jgi:hypothetical protein